MLVECDFWRSRCFTWPICLFSPSASSGIQSMSCLFPEKIMWERSRLDTLSLNWRSLIICLYNRLRSMLPLQAHCGGTRGRGWGGRRKRGPEWRRGEWASEDLMAREFGRGRGRGWLGKSKSKSKSEGQRQEVRAQQLFSKGRKKEGMGEWHVWLWRQQVFEKKKTKQNYRDSWNRSCNIGIN